MILNQFCTCYTLAVGKRLAGESTIHQRTPNFLWPAVQVSRTEHLHRSFNLNRCRVASENWNVQLLLALRLYSYYTAMQMCCRNYFLPQTTHIQLKLIYFHCSHTAVQQSINGPLVTQLHWCASVLVTMKLLCRPK